MAIITVTNDYDDFNIVLLESEGRYSVSIDKYKGNSKKVIVPENIEGFPVTQIGIASFFDNNLRQVILPEGLISIEMGAFRNCINLVEINLPQSLIYIDTSAFENCEKLKKITIPKNIEYFGNIDLQIIGTESETFSGCESLREIIVDEQNPAYVSKEGVLFDKKMTTLLKYPSGKKGAYTIPDSVNNIKKNAFENCSKLTKLNIPKDLLFIEYGEFDKCERLTDFIVNENNPMYISIDGVLFDKKGTTLLHYPQGNKRKVYNVPGSVTLIREGAFNHCNSLTSITLPEGLKFIYGQFICKRLSSITLPMSLLFLDSNMFVNCPNLKTITLSRKTKMGYKALEGFSGELIYRD